MRGRRSQPETAPLLRPFSRHSSERDGPEGRSIRPYARPGTSFDTRHVAHARTASGSSSGNPLLVMAPYVSFAVGTVLFVSARWYARRRPAPQHAVAYNDDIAWI